MVDVKLDPSSNKDLGDSSYDRESISPLAARGMALSSCINSLPTFPEMAAEYERELTQKAALDMACLSGNPMSSDEILKVLNHDPTSPEDPSGPTVARARREISNLKLVYGPLPKGRIDRGIFQVTEAFVKKVHAVMLQGTGVQPLGDYTPHPPTSQDALGKEGIATHMDRLIRRINVPSASMDGPLVRAAIFHHQLMSLNPFGSGSSRVAMFLETTILTVGGFRFGALMLPGYYHRNIDRYLGFFHESVRDENLTSFIEFVCNGMIEALEAVREQLHTPIRRLVLQEHFNILLRKKKIKTRPYELLKLLLDHGQPFLIKDLFLHTPFKILYDKVSEHTARRDLYRLIDLGLLTKDGTSYTFNDRALEQPGRREK